MQPFHTMLIIHLSTTVHPMLLQVVCDGMYSAFRTKLTDKRDIKHPSYFVALLLKVGKREGPTGMASCACWPCRLHTAACPGSAAVLHAPVLQGRHNMRSSL